MDTNCIQEFTQVWWSVRPHHTFGTVEIRICDAQTELWQSLAIIVAGRGPRRLASRTLRRGAPLPVPETRYIEENLWRAIRYGLDGKLVDFERMREELAAADAVRELVELARRRRAARAAPVPRHVEHMLREGNGAQRQLRAVGKGESMTRRVRRDGASALRDEVPAGAAHSAEQQEEDSVMSAGRAGRRAAEAPSRTSAASATRSAQRCCASSSRRCAWPTWLTT